MEAETVLVTGASRGIGRAIALRLARNGKRVAVHYASNDAEAHETARLLGDACTGIYRSQFGPDADPAALWAAVNAAGPVGALVNNAGVYAKLDFLGDDDERFRRSCAETMAVNFGAPLELIRCACKTFAAAGGGKIVNVASRVGFKGEAGAAIYAASKAALINLTRSLAVELAGKRVHIFAVAPGWVETAMVRRDVEENLSAILAGIPLGRMASPEDCAGAVAFLLSTEAEYLSGITIDVNGASYFH